MISLCSKNKHSIKLLATSKKIDHKIFARVSPVMISDEHPLATVKGVLICTSKRKCCWRCNALWERCWEASYS